MLELIGGQDCVLSAQEIADELRGGGREVGVATVYRTLELLEELQLVQRLDVGGGSARYEPALPGGAHHHHHLVCDDCGRVTPFEDPSLERAIESLAGRLDHTVGDHDVILKGSCPDCARARRRSLRRIHSTEISHVPGLPVKPSASASVFAAIASR